MVTFRGGIYRYEYLPFFDEHVEMFITINTTLGRFSRSPVGRYAGGCRSSATVQVQRRRTCEKRRYRYDVGTSLFLYYAVSSLLLSSSLSFLVIVRVCLVFFFVVVFYNGFFFY